MRNSVVLLGAVLERARCVGGRIHHISVERTATPPGCRHADPFDIGQPIVTFIEFVIRMDVNGQAGARNRNPDVPNSSRELGCVVAGAFRRDSPVSAMAAGPPRGYDCCGERRSHVISKARTDFKADRLLSALKSHRKGAAWVVGPAALTALAVAATGTVWAQNPPDDKPAQPARYGALESAAGSGWASAAPGLRYPASVARR